MCNFWFSCGGENDNDVYHSCYSHSYRFSAHLDDHYWNFRSVIAMMLPVSEGGDHGAVEDCADMIYVSHGLTSVKAT